MNEDRVFEITTCRMCGTKKIDLLPVGSDVKFVRRKFYICRSCAKKMFAKKYHVK
jgi:ribosomal protein S14